MNFFKHKYFKISIIGFFLLMISINAKSQSDPTLQKYWRYRERLKNFVVPGTCFGCSQPGQERKLSGSIEWSDAGIMQGYYIGVLSTEYSLLKKNDATSPQCATTARELFYAVETLNRLDLYAEYYWDEMVNGINHNGQAPPQSNLNGFFIRDDIKEDTLYLNQQVNGKSVKEQLLSSSSFPLKNKYNLTWTESGYTFGHREGKGPREESQDQVIQLLTGLALVSKLIDNNLTAVDVNGNPLVFMDGETSIRKETLIITDRIISWMRSHDWLIKNPVMPECVQGVCSSRSCTLGACGGGNTTGLSYGFSKANCFVQGKSDCSLDNNSSGNSILWSAVYRYTGLGDQDYKLLCLATIGEGFGSATDNVLVNRSVEDGAEHLTLLYHILHSGGKGIPDSYFINLLNSAPCNGTNAYEGDYHWWGASRLTYGPNYKKIPYSGEYNGIDYMLFFNLFVLDNPNYLRNGYHYINPEKICDNEINLQGDTANEFRHLQAKKTITAKNYFIGSEDSLKAFVSFTAGQEVNLETGFTVYPGATFDAIIKTGLEAYQCNSGFDPSSLGGTPIVTMKVFPNPASDLTFLEVNGIEVAVEAILAIYTMDGRLIRSEKLKTSPLIPVDISTLIGGIYLVKLSINGSDHSALLIAGIEH
jgi:hypothetical protein